METKDQVVKTEKPKGLSAIKTKFRRFLAANPKQPEYIPPSVLYDFPLLYDPSFTSSLNKQALEDLDIRKQTISTTEEAMRDLDIQTGFRIITEHSTQPEDETTIYKESGIGGVVVSPSEIRFHVDPNNPNAPEAIKHRRERQIAHELNHLARLQAGVQSKNLLDFIIGEGLGVYYEEHWQGNFQPSPLREMVTKEQAQDTWVTAQPHLDQSTQIRDRWFNGKADLPAGAGYAIGTSVVEAFFAKNPEAKMKDVVKLPSKEILEKSGFGG